MPWAVNILSRIIYGARVSIFIGVVVIFMANCIVILAGLAAGYLRGWTDVVISPAGRYPARFPLPDFRHSPDRHDGTGPARIFCWF